MQNRKPSPRTTVLTVGHSNRPLEEFVRLLQAHGTTLVADVRKMPGSRRNPQFSRDTLPRDLHQVAGEITVQCLEGRIAFTAGGATRELSAGQMLYLAGNEPHSLRGVEDASVLVTILLHQPRGE